MFDLLKINLYVFFHFLFYINDYRVNMLTQVNMNLFPQLFFLNNSYIIKIIQVYIIFLFVFLKCLHCSGIFKKTRIGPRCNQTIYLVSN